MPVWHVSFLVKCPLQIALLLEIANASYSAVIARIYVRFVRALMPENQDLVTTFICYVPQFVRNVQ
jgi:hypothetical protein